MTELKKLRTLEGTPQAIEIPLTKNERLRRWADILMALGNDTRLKSLYQIEYQDPAKRGSVRADNSAISVAANDPVLRSAGLAGDTVDDAKKFFSLTEGEVHNLVCYCHGDELPATSYAGRVEGLIK